MGFGRFMMNMFISKEKLVKAAKEASEKYDIPLDESILDDKDKILDWLEDDENQKLFKKNHKPKKHDNNSITDMPVYGGGYNIYD